jgi:hypothetical protein
VDVKTNIDRFDVDIKIWGNIWSDFASAFEVFFVGTVVDEIESAIQTGLNVTLPTVVNGFINNSEALVPVPTIPNWMMDLESETRYLVT